MQLSPLEMRLGVVIVPDCHCLDRCKPSKYDCLVEGTSGAFYACWRHEIDLEKVLLEISQTAAYSIDQMY